MLKMALFDCAINEKRCSVDGGRGICPLFPSPPRGDLTTQESPPPGICHPRQKKMLKPGGQPGGCWAKVELTGALWRVGLTKSKSCKRLVDVLLFEG